MATQTVEYLSSTKLCCGTLPVDVILCVPTTVTLLGVAYVEAQLTAQSCYKTGCTTSYLQTFTIDDSQLAEDITLSGSEITGVFCKGCVTTWVEDLVGPPWQDWEPTFSGVNAMTFTAVTTQYARFLQVGKTVWGQIGATGTIGGVVDQYLQFTLPVASVAAAASKFNHALTNNGAYAAGHLMIPNADNTIGQAALSTLGNWTAGAGREFYSNFFYQTA